MIYINLIYFIPAISIIIRQNCFKIVKRSEVKSKNIVIVPQYHANTGEEKV
jgi:hypothetical protein